MKKLISFISAFIAVLCLTACGGKSQSDNNSTITKSEQQEQTNSTWQYYKHEDELTHNVTSLYAVIYSTNSKIIDSFGCYAQSDDLKVGKLGNYTTTGYISEFINTISGEILADSENSDEICYEVAHMQINSIQRFRYHLITKNQ